MIRDIIHDKWFSNIIGYKAYKVLVDGINQFDLSGSKKDRFEELLGNKVFMYSKIPTDQLSAIKFLEDHQFNLVDTNVVLNKRKQNNLALNAARFSNVRKSAIGDKEQVIDIAAANFKYSRFHLDPGIKNTIADEMKAKWVENYYLGKRGNAMVVAIDNDKITGFLLLLKNNDQLIIDLIAVDEDYQGMGIASKMITFAESNYEHDTFIVGTQIANVPSIRLYEKLGFKMYDSSYVFHYHH